ncbi:hypothetical protein [Streptomyces sp. NPDC048057]|uniref:hypothetical protein n=1 Tax=Streptomyces sp. NPDC048057 TaxID=3155628 RepID=UPI0033EADF7C
MITNNTSFINFQSMADRSAVVSVCSLGFSTSLLAANGTRIGKGTGVSGGLAGAPATSMAGRLPVLREERAERPTKALEAGLAQAQVYAFAAASAVTPKQTQHHTKWAFRGLEPWSDPA